MAKGQKKQKQTETSVQKLLTCIEKWYSIKSACGKVNIARNTFYQWIKEDDFRTKIQDAEFRRIAFVESKKAKLIEDWYWPAILNELKCKLPATYWNIRSNESWEVRKWFTVKVISGSLWKTK